MFQRQTDKLMKASPKGWNDDRLKEKDRESEMFMLTRLAHVWGLFCCYFASLWLIRFFTSAVKSHHLVLGLSLLTLSVPRGFYMFVLAIGAKKLNVSFFRARFFIMPSERAKSSRIYEIYLKFVTWIFKMKIYSSHWE